MYKGEFFNSISHLVAAALALVGASVLITLAAVEGDAVKIVSYSVYSATLFLLYLFSTLYHSFQGRVKALFRKFDHHAIYLLIAGTYTPFALVAVEGATGWWLFGVVWSLAVIGIIVENLPIKGPRVIPHYHLYRHGLGMRIHHGIHDCRHVHTGVLFSAGRGNYLYSRSGVLCVG